MLLPKGVHIDLFVNADTIAQGLAAFAPETVALEAGRIMLARIHELAAGGQSFAFESTLASRTFAPFLRSLREQGYLVQVYYVWLRSPELSIQRVAARVRRGGHHIPDDVIRRRYRRGMTNFLKLYRPLADVWVLCDNSGESLVRVAAGSGEQVVEVFAEELWDEFRRLTERGEGLAD